MNQPLAYVHPQAKIARNVVIEPFTTIHNNVVPLALGLGLVLTLRLWKVLELEKIVEFFRAQ